MTVKADGPLEAAAKAMKLLADALDKQWRKRK